MVDWDLYAEKYERIQADDPVHSMAIGAIVDRLNPTDQRHVLDLGCGTGDVTGKILERFPGTNIVGVDPSREMGRMYLERFMSNANIEILEGDGLNIPVDDCTLDTIVSHIALHHIVPDRRVDCAREMARVLKSGGKLVYCDCFTHVGGPLTDRSRRNDIIDTNVAWAKYCLDHGADEKALILIKSIPLVLTADGEYPTTTGEWTGCLKDAGFINVEVSPVQPEEFGLYVIEAIRNS